MNKIPKSAKKVFQGQIFDIYQWEQKMFDGTTKIFELAKRKNSVQVIAVTTNNKILILDESQPGSKPFLSIPGGRIDDENKDPLLQAKEELLEETGYESDDWDLMFTHNLGSKVIHETYYYIARNSKQVSSQTLDKGGEKINFKEVSFEDFLEFTQEEKFRNKFLSNYIFKMLHSPKKLEKLKFSLMK